jgi:pyruvate kinase
MANSRRVKIVCTIGPASRPPAVLRRLIATGLDVARLNFSHGTHAEHGQIIKAVNRAAVQSGKEVAILADLSGPKLRTGIMPGNQEVVLKAGAEFDIVSGPAEGSAVRVGVNDVALPCSRSGEEPSTAGW